MTFINTVASVIEGQGSTAGVVIGMANDALGGVKAGELNAFFMGSPLGNIVGKLGMQIAAQGGKLVKGRLQWNDPLSDNPVLQSLKFPIYPEEITESHRPVYAEFTVPGQNRPIYQFINGGPRELSFTLQFFYENRNRATIRNQIRSLQALTQRSVQSVDRTKFAGPPTVQFLLGSFYTPGDRFIVTEVTMRAFDLFHPLLLLPMRASVDITLLHTPTGDSGRIAQGTELGGPRGFTPGLSEV